MQTRRSSTSKAPSGRRGFRDVEPLTYSEDRNMLASEGPTDGPGRSLGVTQAYVTSRIASHHGQRRRRFTVSRSQYTYS
jgi:hypothetical protein